ncbi:MAG: SpoIIE family protein phosphatase, partial [Clostridia bacterium]|nr:SpoIIE family protein phosphatase [Clostridia bacterium]
HCIHLFGGGESQNAEHSVVVRNRQEIGKKLTNMAKVFSEIGGVLGGAELVVSANNSLELAGEIAVEHCAKCPNYKFCSAMLGGDTTLAIKDMVDKALYNGVLTKDDLSPFLQGRCTRQDSLINIVSDKSQRMMKILDRKSQIGAGRIILGEQMQSLSSMLLSLGQEVKSAVFFDNQSEENITTELYYYNIVCRDIVVSGENGAYGVALTVRHKDSSKSALPNVVSKVLKGVFEVVDCSASKIAGFDVVTLKQSPKYAISYGVATKVMDGSSASGDTFSITNVAYDKAMLVLCDGMGSGEKANFNSTSTIGMIENFYKAGFNNNAILSLINKILATYNNDTFTCLDMAMVDLTAGIVDIIKLGGTQSMIIRNDKCYLMGGGALPLGIVEEAKPYTDRHIVMDGDIIVMFTDGISDYLGIESIGDMIINNPASNPEHMAEDILRSATSGGAKDDSTVIVAKIYAKK